MLLAVTSCPRRREPSVVCDTSVDATNGVAEGTGDLAVSFDSICAPLESAWNGVDWMMGGVEGSRDLTRGFGEGPSLRR